MELCYEEQMPLSSPNEDYTVYFLNEDISDFDRCNLIIKKGKNFQHLALINNLSLYANNISFFHSLVTFLIQNIDLWDTASKFAFAEALAKSINIMITNSSLMLSQSEFIEIINAIITHMIYAIATYEENVSESYINNFIKIIDDIAKRDVVDISQNVYTFVDSLGKFGQNVKNKKICVFLSATLSPIKSKFKAIVFNRYITLSGCNEREVKLQVVYELNKIIKVFYSDDCFRSEIDKVILFYNNEDREHVVQCEAICSVIKNFCLIKKNKEMLDIVLKKINEIINETDYEKDLVIKLITILLKDVSKKENEDIAMIVNNKGIIRNVINISKNKLYSQILLDCYSDICIVLSNDSVMINEVYDILLSYDIFTNEEISTKFYDNFYKFIEHIPNDKIMNIFTSANITRMISSKSFDKLFNVISSSNSLHFVLPLIIQQISASLTSIPHINMIPYLNSVNSTIVTIYNSSHLYPKKEELYSKIYHYVKLIITSLLGYHIKSAAVSIVPNLIKYSKNRDTYISFIHNIIATNSSFYIRRLFIVFIRACFSTLSTHFLMEKNIYIDFIPGVASKIPIEAISYLQIFNKNYDTLSQFSLATIRAIKTRKDFDNDIKNEVNIALSKANSIPKANPITISIENDRYKEEVLIRKKETAKILLNADSNSIDRHLMPRAISKQSSRGKNILPPMTTTNKESSKRFNFDIGKKMLTKNEIENITYSNFYNAKALGYKTKTLKVFNPILSSTLPNSRNNFIKRHIKLVGNGNIGYKMTLGKEN